MSIAAVSHGYVFGLSSNLRENIFFIEDNTVLYPAGSNVIISNLEQKSQKFIPVSEPGDVIAALAISPDRHVFGIGQNSPSEPSIHVYDLHTFRKRRKLSVPKGVTEIVSMAFSVDSKYLAVQTGAPDWILSFYAWEKGKPLASISMQPSHESEKQINHVTINPFDGNEMMISGYGRASIIRYLDSTLKSTSIEVPTDLNFISHVWISMERALLVSKEGIMLLVENGKVSHSETHGNNETINCIQMTKFGVAVAGNSGKILIYNCMLIVNTPVASAIGEAAPAEKFKIVQKLSMPDAFSQIVSMASAPGEDHILIRIGNNQVLKVAMSVSADLAAAGNNQNTEGVKYETYIDSFHSNSITGLDLCIRKPVVATCSSDKTIRIWNYLGGTCELTKQYADEPQSIALHPTGLYLLAGFSDKLRLFNILMDDLHPVREFSVRACKKCCFANGGHIFAAVHGNVIQIFSTWTFENMENLKGHNGKIKSLYFTPDDNYLVSAGTDGAVYTWNIRQMKREHEHILKSCTYFDAVCSPNGKVMYAVGSDKMIKEITESITTKEFEGNQVMTQIALSNSGRMLFVGTRNGSIRALRYPFGDHHDFQEHQAHTGPVTKLRISHDDQYLFSTGEDGCLYMFKLTDKEDRAKKVGDKSSFFADEILITKSDLEEKTVLMAEIQRQLDELKLEHEYQLRLKDMNFNEKLKEVTETYSQEIESLKVSTSILRTEKEKEDVKHQEQIQNLKTRYVGELHEIDIKNNGELMAQYEKYQVEQNKTASLQEKWLKQMKEFEITAKKRLSEVNVASEARLNTKSLDIQRLVEELKDQEREFHEMSNQNQQDIDTEMLLANSKYEKKLRAEREEGARLKGENGIMRKKFNTLNKDIDDNRAEIIKMKETSKKLESVIVVLEREILHLRKEMSDRDEHIQDKERKVYDLKKRNQELEKYKFVLDYRIKELKEQVEPRENHIAEMSTEIQNLNENLKDFNKDKLALEDTILKYEASLVQVKAKIIKEHRRMQKISRYSRIFKVDLEEVMTHFQDSSVLKKAVENLYNKYSSSTHTLDDEISKPKSSKGNNSQTRDDLELTREYQAHQSHLKAEISSLRLEAETRITTYRLSTVHAMNENQQLIKEINKLREVPKQKTLMLPQLTKS